MLYNIGVTRKNYIANGIMQLFKENFNKNARFIA